MPRKTRIAMVGKEEALNIEADADELRGLASSLHWEWRVREAAPESDPEGDS
jgi:hypothetical protein